MSGQCATCRYWGDRDPSSFVSRPGFGTCELAASGGDHISKPSGRFLAEDGDGRRAILSTRYDFGCVCWADSAEPEDVAQASQLPEPTSLTDEQRAEIKRKRELALRDYLAKPRAL